MELQCRAGSIPNSGERAVRRIKNGSPMVDRIMRFVSPEPMSGCWLWTGAIDQKQYARIGISGKNLQVHRISYELFKGKIPDGLCIDHLCRVRFCVNPDHMEPVTPQVNSARGLTGIFGRSKTHCPRGHEYTPENTYRSPGRYARRSCLICRRELGAAGYQRRKKQCQIR